MAKRIPRKLLERLQEARKSATFETAHFFVFKKNADELNADIRERTRIYRETWVIPAMDAIIAWANGAENDN